ncbi:MAG: alanine racemase [Clostridia bacterium]|nr:alanine racemase [Clostridia bacterium]
MKYKNAAYIDTAALAENYRVITERASGAQVIAVVKADAYGHGMACAASVLGEAGCGFFAVSSEEEAAELRRLEAENGRHPSIIILGHIMPENAWEMAENDIICTAVSYDNAVLLDRVMAGSPKKLTIHIKLDTGMNRVGFPADDANRAKTVEHIAAIAGFKNLTLGGIFTHFSCADTDLTGEDTGYTAMQLERYRKTIAALEEAGVDPGIRHAANSAALLGLPEAHFDAVRAGIILYGLSPSGDRTEALNAGLRPVMKFCAGVTHIHKVPAGDKVSYGGTYTAETERVIAVIAAGYADGYERSYIGCPVIIGGRKYRSVGRICMDQFMVDITGHEYEIGVGQEVTLFGGDDGELIETLASASHTINYEVLCKVSRRVRRITVK